MDKNKTRLRILELCSESEYGSWEFWSNKENKTSDECNEIVQAIIDLVEEHKIFPIEYSTVRDQSYQEVLLDIDRLKSEVEQSMQLNNIDRKTFYWFLATDSGSSEYKTWAKEYWTEERTLKETEKWRKWQEEHGNQLPGPDSPIPALPPPSRT